nr:MAG TPA: hypothetical protein [Caudoviricetes sp.]
MPKYAHARAPHARGLLALPTGTMRDTSNDVGYIQN